MRRSSLRVAESAAAAAAVALPKLPATTPFVTAMASGRIGGARIDDCYYSGAAVDEASPLCATFVTARNATRRAHASLKASEAKLPSVYSQTAAATAAPGIPWHPVADATLQATLAKVSAAGFLSPDSAAAAGAQLKATLNANGSYSIVGGKGKTAEVALKQAPAASGTVSVVVSAPVENAANGAEQWGLFLVEAPVSADGGDRVATTGLPVARSMLLPEGGLIAAKPIVIGAEIKDAVIRSLTASRVRFAGETAAVLDRLQEAVAHHAKTTFEYGHIRGTRQMTQRHISVLASTIFAVESAGLLLAAIDADSAAADNSAAQDSALLASYCRRALMLRSSDAVDLISPALAHAVDAPTKPLDHRFIQSAFADAHRASQSLGPVDGIVAEVLRASLSSVVPPPTPSRLAAAYRGNLAVATERAAALFRVPPTLSTATIRLSEDVDATNRLLLRVKEDSKKTNSLQYIAPIASELFVSTCAAFRASCQIDKDEALGYGAGLRATVALDASANLRADLLATASTTFTESHTIIADAIRLAKGGRLAITPPSELPNVAAASKKAAQPKPSGAGAAGKAAEGGAAKPKE